MTNIKRISCNGDRTRFPYLQVWEAISKVNELFESDAFYEQIAEQSDFDQADVSPVTIAALMKKARLEMSVDLYYARNPLKNIDGYDDHNDPSIIHMNVWKIDRPVASICNSLVHAMVHAVNSFYDRFYFGHDSIPGMPKENTAPYRIGAIAEAMISGNEAPFITMEHDTVETDHSAAHEPGSQIYAVAAKI